MHGGPGLLIRVRTKAWECINFPLCIMARGCRRLMDQTSYSSTSSNPGSVCKPPGSVPETTCEPGKWYPLLVLACLQRLDRLSYSLPSSLTACWVGKLWSTLPGLDLLWDISHLDLQSFPPFHVPTCQVIKNRVLRNLRWKSITVMFFQMNWQSP